MSKNSIGDWNSNNSKCMDTVPQIWEPFNLNKLSIIKYQSWMWGHHTTCLTHNKSYLGVTASWYDGRTLKRPAAILRLGIIIGELTHIEIRDKLASIFEEYEIRDKKNLVFYKFYFIATSVTLIVCLFHFIFTNFTFNFLIYMSSKLF